MCPTLCIGDLAICVLFVTGNWNYGMVLAVDLEGMMMTHANFPDHDTICNSIHLVRNVYLLCLNKQWYHSMQGTLIRDRHNSKMERKPIPWELFPHIMLTLYGFPTVLAFSHVTASWSCCDGGMWPEESCSAPEDSRVHGWNKGWCPNEVCN